MSRLFDRYGDADLACLFEEVGLFDTLRSKGFGEFRVVVEQKGLAIPHIMLSASKGGVRHRLLDACLRRIVAGVAGQNSDPLVGDIGPVTLLLVHWVREEDPTAAFAPERPALPLQNHPGLGVLRLAFRVAVRIASDLGADGVASQPKFFHDAVIFHRSRLFRFLDGGEEGRFEALQRDLDGMPLCDATMAVAGWCVRDQHDRIARWQPGFQVFPLSARLTAHFHSPQYAAAVAAGRDGSSFRIDRSAFRVARAQLEDISP